MLLLVMWCMVYDNRGHVICGLHHTCSCDAWSVSCLALFLVLQTQLGSGKQLVHTEYLQLLTAMAIGLGMDAPLVSPPHPPHLPPVPTSRDWLWLKTFTSAISMANSFRKKQPLLVDEAMVSLDLPQLQPGEKFQPKVCCTISEM